MEEKDKISGVGDELCESVAGQKPDHVHCHDLHEHGENGHSHDGEQTHGGKHEHGEHTHNDSHTHGEHTHNEHEHSDHSHGEHGHYHSPEEKKRQLNRLARISGHLNHVRSMIENDEDCADVLIQISAIRSALNGLGKQIINEHITHCIAHAIEEGDQTQIEEFQKAIQKFI